MLNGVAGGTLIVVNTYYQQQLDFNSQQTGYISLTYLVAVLIMIRVGEKILQALDLNDHYLWEVVLQL